ncbi:hypothetical protein C8J57DRAFT_1570179 [Mycena rebaudengoi]|nr:hypothetical protein C8J57DRAFT_1570179 [Mycena rebaudengoi]
MSMSGLRLEDLAEDILGLILCTIWLLGGLSIYRTTALEEYSAAQLREEVHGSRPPDVVPCSARGSTRLPGNQDPWCPDAQPNVQLLPGGAYFVAEYASRIELWRVATRSVIWLYPLIDSVPCSRYAIELVDRERSIIFLDIKSHYVVRIIRIDRDTGHELLLSRVERPQHAGYYDIGAVSGDFYLCQVWPLSNRSLSSRYYIVGNWRTETNVVLEYKTPNGRDWRPYQIKLAAGWSPTSTTSSGHLRDFNQGTSQSEPIDLRRRQHQYLPATVIHELPATYPRCARMMVYKSPLRHDTYKLMLYSTANEQPAARRYSLERMFQTVTALSGRKAGRLQVPCTFHTFHFSTSNHTIVNWALTAAVPASLIRASFCPLSYAGYTDIHDVVSQRIVNIHVRDPCTGKRRDTSHEGAVLAQWDSWQDDGSAAGDILVHRWLSPYSHAVVAVECSTYVISYYV